MTSRRTEIVVDTRSRGRGLYEITSEVNSSLRALSADNGLAHVFVQHTSCSLIIQENADPTAAADLLDWFERLAPEGDPRYTHTFEGPDDMPAHLRASVTRTSEQVPVVNGVMGLGTWQGLFLFEHRRRGGRRRLWLTYMV